MLAVDELVDQGKILEVEPKTIANRVLMRGVDGTVAYFLNDSALPVDARDSRAYSNVPDNVWGHAVEVASAVAAAKRAMMRKTDSVPPACPSGVALTPRVSSHPRSGTCTGVPCSASRDQ